MHHKLSYTDEALVSAAKLSYQYISDRFLPDKAIDLLDEAGSCVRLRHAQLPKELDKELRQTTKREMDLWAQITALVDKGKEMTEAAGNSGPVVTEVDIQHID
ncbi:hypothetical protein RHMOL_Rhmol01G0152000 [Rhododendron molle]|uniref:Uncharacterized protein n=2 Tax=Rhododendron molle TaxID=49168 RepID=A0ACC0Q328_RHOML|nr:hypothetical protein RHMOL_Rhmol01G0152000 [Rhododendron molle]KAI8571852.1 hypothetical protein RHMOL_Rhmol01G0152000 [Rhododendron molle]